MDAALIDQRQLVVDTKAFAVPILFYLTKAAYYKLMRTKEAVVGGIRERGSASSAGRCRKINQPGSMRKAEAVTHTSEQA